MPLPGGGAIRPDGPLRPRGMRDTRTLRIVVLGVIVVAAAIVLALALAGGPLRALVAGRIRALAGARGLEAAWTSLRVTPAMTASVTGLALTRRSDGAVLLRADSLEARVDPWSLLRLTPRLARVDLAGVTITGAAHGTADPDTLVPDEPRPRSRADDPARAARVREAARSVVRLLTVPARDLPRVSLRDLVVTGAGTGDDEEEDGSGAERLRLD